VASATLDEVLESRKYRLWNDRRALGTDLRTVRRRRTAALEIMTAGLLLALAPLLIGNSPLAFALLGAGVLLLAVGGRLFWRQYRR
jgi:hypothetical protein